MRSSSRGIPLLVALLMLPVALLAADNPTPQEFVSRAAEASLAEIQLSKLALQKATDSGVKNLAQKMVTDHSAASAKLERIATAKALNVPKMLNPEHQKALNELGKETGKDFDEEYMEQMVKDHHEAVALFTSGSRLTDRELATFAADTLPTLKMHEEMAEDLEARH